MTVTLSQYLVRINTDQKEKGTASSLFCILFVKSYSEELVLFFVLG